MTKEPGGFTGVDRKRTIIKYTFEGLASTPHGKSEPSRLTGDVMEDLGAAFGLNPGSIWRFCGGGRREGDMCSGSRRIG